MTSLLHKYELSLVFSIEMKDLVGEKLDRTVLLGSKVTGKRGCSGEDLQHPNI